MFVDPTNYGDADKYFRTCFIKVKEYGDTLVRVDKVTEEALWGEDENGEGVCIEINGHETGVVGYTLDYVIPKKAFFQVGDKAAFLGRIPARMWKKGVSKENTLFYTLSDGFSPWEVKFESLKAYVRKPVYLPYTEIKGNRSLALSPRFALSANGSVWLDTTMVGKFYAASKTLICKKLFMKDLQPLFPGVKIAKG